MKRPSRHFNALILLLVAHGSQALSVRDPSEVVPDSDDEDDSRKGFFSRFKRS